MLLLLTVASSLLVPTSRSTLTAPTAATAAPAPVVAETLATPTWQIDRSHSELTFVIRHLVSRVRGTFGDWSGTIVADPERLADARVEVTIRTASIDTNHERRDGHLRSADFFDAELHPTITFRSTRIETRGERLAVHGELTMRGVTRPVVLEGRWLGITGAPGKRRAGIEATTTVNRLDYGVSWNRAAEGGGAVLGDEVTIELVIAAVEKS